MNQILALGGGRFSVGVKHIVMEKYLLRTSNKTKPAICFLATASGDSPDYLDAFYEAFSEKECTPSHLPLITPIKMDIGDFLLKQDIIYVGGGNTKNMLALWREWGVDAILRKCYEAGIVLAGWSAGAICWFEQGVTDSIPGALTAMNCLGWLPGSCCPHYDSEAERRPAVHRLITEGKLKAGVAIEDATALHFVEGKLDKVIASKPGSRAYSFRLEGGKAIERELPIDYLE
ncbi:MAG TPA: peptidase E [Anaerolineales bacterium]